MPAQTAHGMPRQCPRVALRRCVALVMALHAFAWPQAALPKDDRDLSEFEHTEWTARHGLPGQVSELAQTKDGFLWLASGHTLFRFDGMTFEPIRSNDGEPIPRVMALAAHPDGSLWAGLRRGGLARLANGQATILGREHGVPEGFVYDLAIGDDGIVVAAIADQLVTGDGNGWRVHALGGSEENPGIRNVLVDRNGGAWAGGARLWYRAPGEQEFLPSPVPVDGVARLAEAPDGQVWALESGASAIVRVTPTAAGSVSVSAHPGRFSTMVFDLDGGLWIGTTGDGIRYVPAPGESAGDDAHWPRFAGAQGLSGEVVGAALRDREGNLWFGTNAGLDRFRQPELAKAGFPAAAYNFALAVDAEGAVWAGSMNRNAMRLTGTGLVTTQVPPPSTVAHRSPHGDVWLAGPGGFWKSRGSAIERVTDLPAGVASNTVVRALVDGGKGKVWASLNDEGLYRWQAGRWTREPVRGPLPSQKMPVRAVLDQAGNPWFGYRDNLLVSLQDGKVLQWDSSDGLAVGHVTAILPTEDRFWVGGTEGLGLFDGSTFIPMQFADGFRIRGLHGLVETVTGEIWLHVDDGLFRIEADQLARFLRDPAFRVSPKRLGPIEPMADDSWQLRPLPTALSGADGTIWIATSLGVRRADPRRVAAGLAPPKPQVVSLRGDDDAPLDGPGPVLPAQVRRVAIAYTAPGLKAPEILQFRYRLRGYDDEWHHPGGSREATYIGLPPGRYEFELAAAYGDGPWSEPASIQFEIPPALHQTWQFMAFCALVVVALLWIAYHARVRYLNSRLRARLEVQHQERERIARELHDTLLQGVQGLALRLHAAASLLPADEPARAALERSLDLADKVIVEGRDRVMDLRLPHYRPGALLESLAAIGADLSGVHGARFRALAQEPMAPLPATVEEQLFLIAQEAIVNAFRHSQAGLVELEIANDQDGMRLRVRDDGVGMASGVLQERARAGHWGVTGMQERAGKIGARLRIWSREGSGTEIDICLPWTSIPTRVRPRRHLVRWLQRRRKE